MVRMPVQVIMMMVPVMLLAVAGATDGRRRPLNWLRSRYSLCRSSSSSATATIATAATAEADSRH